MDGWKTIQSSLGNLNLGQSANKFAKGFQSSVQATKERFGTVAADEITELPQGIVVVTELQVVILIQSLQNTRTLKHAWMPCATLTLPF
jgi:hypothetical protein